VRPHVSLEDGSTRRIDWPENAFYHGAIPGADRDVVLLLGVEPNTRWRTFTGVIVDLARSLGVECVVTLGALLADVPHTRPSPVTGAATDPAIVARLGLQGSRYEGPTGIVGVLHDACRQADLASVSLWAAVPHYASLAPSPKAALALCRRLGELLEIELDLAELEEAAVAYEGQVSAAVASDDDTAAYVRQLEEHADADDDEDGSESPIADRLADELSRFLREHEARRQAEDEGEPPASGLP
jgi:proteasome assembly chaperone (PAC2) family protein